MYQKLISRKISGPAEKIPHCDSILIFLLFLFQATKVYMILLILLLYCPNVFRAVQQQFPEELRIGGIFDQDQYQLDTLQVRWKALRLYVYCIYDFQIRRRNHPNPYLAFTLSTVWKLRYFTATILSQKFREINFFTGIGHVLVTCRKTLCY